MRELINDFIQVYWRAHNREPNDVQIRIHMEYWSKSDVVSWVKPDEHFKFNEIS